MTDLDLEAIRKRVDALTPQWRYDSYRTVFSAALVSGAPDDPEHYVVCRSVDPKKPEQNDDMDFIADAPDIVRDLLVRIEELEAQLRPEQPSCDPQVDKSYTGQIARLTRQRDALEATNYLLKQRIVDGGETEKQQKKERERS